MARRIACYVIFIALIWGATAEREENIRNLFKSNMTRGDFSNLLKSLIRLNEQRVNVLQKLSRLEDYSMLSEVLRSGDKKGDGNLSNLFLVVLSKNQSDPSRRNMGFQVLDSVPSVNTANFYVGGITLNDSKTAKTTPDLQSKYLMKEEFKSNLADNLSIEDKSNNPIVTRHGSSHVKNKEQESVVAMNDIVKPKGRFEIVSNGGNSNTYKASLDGENSDDVIKLPGNSQKREPAISQISLENDRYKVPDFESGPINSEVHNYESNENDHKHLQLTIQNPYEIRDIKHHKSDRDVTKDGNIIKANTSTDNPSEISTDNKDISLNKHIPVHPTKRRKRHSKQTIVKSVKNNNSNKTSHHKNRHSTKQPKINKKQFSPNIDVKKHPPINKDKSEEKKKDTKPIQQLPQTEQIPEDSNQDAFYVSKENKKDDDRDSKKSKINKDETNKNIQASKPSNIRKIKATNEPQDKKVSKINTERSAETDRVITIDLNEPLGLQMTKDVSSEDERVLKYPSANTEETEEIMHNFELPIDTFNANDKHNSRPKDSRGLHQSIPILNRGAFDGNIQKTKISKDFARHDIDSISKSAMDDYRGFERGPRYKNNIPARGRPLALSDEGSEEPKKGRESRKTFAKCINKKALKMCTKSCNSAYKNVCRRLKCTSRSKKALKKECKRSCKKTFASKSSKYSDESGNSNSDSNSDSNSS
nr:uncharacterized protein LOC110371494 isoform X2 [Helicoverpa armigera]